MKKNVLLFLGMFSFFIFQFKNAFDVHFFQDDYWFLEISKIFDFTGFLHFFSPFRSYSYKPLASETFYMVIHWLHYNVVLAHLIMFVTFFIGVVFMYKNILALTREKLIALLSCLLYITHFTHVFQLYWFATFQEVAVMTLLVMSLFYLLRHRYYLGFFLYTLSLLCKETAALFPMVLILIALFDKQKRISWKTIGVGFIFSGVFYFIYRFSLNQVTSLDNYKMSFNPRLIANNVVWYFLWGMGLPNLMPLYIPALPQLPIDTFWNLFRIPEFKHYFSVLMIYILGFCISVVLLFAKDLSNRKTLFWFGVFCGMGYFIFLGPILLFPHRWMVRLTLPLIFLSLFQGYVLFRLIRLAHFFRYLSVGLLGMYLVWNFYGTQFHEASSLYLPENDIYLRARQLFDTHYSEITQSSTIFFQDDERNRTLTTANSERLKNSFHDQSFTKHFFPHQSIKALYDFETDQVPQNAYIIKTYDLVR